MMGGALLTLSTTDVERVPAAVPSAGRLFSALRAGFRDAPAADRAHVWGRFWLCPFRAILAALTDDGPMLDVGCGHGVLVHLAKAVHPAMPMVGLDIDARKIEVARRCNPWRDVSFICGEVTDVAGSFRWATIADVLICMEFDAWGHVLRAVRDRLEPGGTLLLKTNGRQPAWKHRITHAEEVIMIRWLRITKGSNLTIVDRARVLSLLAEVGFDAACRQIDAGYPHTHLLYVCRKR